MALIERAQKNHLVGTSPEKRAWKFLDAALCLAGGFV
jgi:hypothetical protein